MRKNKRLQKCAALIRDFLRNNMSALRNQSNIRVAEVFDEFCCGFSRCHAVLTGHYDLESDIRRQPPLVCRSHTYCRP